MTRVFKEGIFVLMFAFIPAAFWIFLRGHNLPGGGFIAGSLGVVVIFLNKLAVNRSDRYPYFERVLAGFANLGVIISIISGFIGLMQNGYLFSSVEIIEIFGFKITTEFIFDLGVFLMVLGAGSRIFSVDYGE